MFHMVFSLKLAYILQFRYCLLMFCLSKIKKGVGSGGGGQTYTGFLFSDSYIFLYFGYKNSYNLKPFLYFGDREPVDGLLQ